MNLGAKKILLVPLLLPSLPLELLIRIRVSKVLKNFVVVFVDHVRFLALPLASWKESEMQRGERGRSQEKQLPLCHDIISIIWGKFDLKW